MNPFLSLLPSGTSFLFTKMNWERSSRKQKLGEAELPDVQTAKNYYITTLNHCKYRLANGSLKKDVIVSSFIVNMVKKVKSQRKPHLLDPKDQISIRLFLATSKLSCDTSCIHEGTTMWGLPYHVSMKMASALNNRVYLADKYSPIVTSVPNNNTGS